MPEAPVRGSLLRPTIGRIMGLTVVVAVALAVWRAAFGSLVPAGLPADAACWLVSVSLCLLLQVPLNLGALAWTAAFARGPSGPVRRYYGLLASGVLGLLSGLPFLLQDLVCKGLTGRPTTGCPSALVLGAAIAGGYGLLLAGAWPRRCPACGRRSVIRQFRGPPPRPARSPVAPVWCASCGAEFAPDATPVRWRPRAASPG
jgi:predicted RNA-binding Zn-ribbon protein involved in translation (DUF1610 family)